MLGLLNQIYDFFQAPNMVRYARLHRRGASQGHVNAGEIVIHEMQGDSVSMVLDLL